MQTNQQSASGGITRRSFIKFGGAAALTLALPGALSSLTGCRSLAEIYVFSLAPELQGGCAYQFTDEELAYLPDDMGKLKYMGSLAGGGEIDLEMLMTEDIQLVFDVSAVAISSSDISTCNNLQDQTDIPVVMVDGSFTNVMNAYRFIGDIMGQTARAEKIAAYCEGIYDDVRAAVGDIPDERKVSLYYAEGPFGLASEPNESLHARTFAEAGARKWPQCLCPPAATACRRCRWSRLSSGTPRSSSRGTTLSAAAPMRSSAPAPTGPLSAPCATGACTPCPTRRSPGATARRESTAS